MEKMYGIPASVDIYGRITVPKQIRDMFKIEPKSFVQTIVTDEGILIKPINYDIIIKERK